MSIKKPINNSCFMFYWRYCRAAADTHALIAMKNLRLLTKRKRINDIRIKHLQRDVACSIDCHATTLMRSEKQF